MYCLALMYASIFGNVSAIIQRLYSGTARSTTAPQRSLVHFHIVVCCIKMDRTSWTYSTAYPLQRVQGRARKNEIIDFSIYKYYVFFIFIFIFLSWPGLKTPEAALQSGTRENLKHWEGQTYSTPEHKYHLTWDKKGVWYSMALSFNYYGSL